MGQLTKVTKLTGAENLHIRMIHALYLIVFAVYFSDSATMHTRIETNKLGLPVILFVMSSRNIHYVGLSAITIFQQLFISAKCNHSIY